MAAVRAAARVNALVRPRERGMLRSFHAFMLRWVMFRFLLPLGLYGLLVFPAAGAASERADCLALSGAWSQPAEGAAARQRLEQAMSGLLPARVLLVGEQHNAPEHQQLQLQLVEWLAVRGQLAALALEMAAQGRDTRGLPRSAHEADVRAALAWNERAWPWENYGPAIMAAVRAGVPVAGANLPRERMQAAMRDEKLDQRLPAAQLQVQQGRIRQSHCGLLPEEQIAPMTRVQIARDVSMAQVAARLAGQAASGQTVVLVAGNGHTHCVLGVPRFLPAQLQARVLSARTAAADGAQPLQADPAQEDALDAVDAVWLTPALALRDHCADLRALRQAGSSKPSGAAP